MIALDLSEVMRNLGDVLSLEETEELIAEADIDGDGDGNATYWNDI